MRYLLDKILFLFKRTRYPDKYKHLFDGSTLSCYFSEEEKRIYHYYIQREMYRREELRFWIILISVIALACLPIFVLVILIFKFRLL